MARRLILTLGVVTGLLLVVAASAVLFRTTLAAAVLESRLASMGVPGARLDVASLDSRRMVVTGIALGEAAELRIDRATIAYRLRALLSGRLDDVAVDGLRLRLDLSGAGPPLGSLQALIERDDGAAGGGVLPAAVRLSRGRIDATAPAGDVSADFSATWRPAAGTATLTVAELALPKITLETSRVHVEATPDRIVATATLHGASDGLDLDLRAVVDSYGQDPTLDLALHGGLGPAALNVPALPLAGDGRVTVSLELAGRLQSVRQMPLDAAALDWLLGADLRGRLQAALRDIAWRERAQGVSGALDLALSVADGTLVIDVAHETGIRVARIDPALFEALGMPALAPRLRDAGLTVAAATRDAPLRMRVRKTAGGADLAISGAADVALAEAVLEVRADGSVMLDRDFALRRIAFTQADMRLRDLVIGGHRLESLQFEGAIDGTPGALSGGGELVASSAATQAGALAIGAARLGISADFEWSGSRFAVRQRGDGTIALAAAGAGPAARIAGPFSLRLSDGALTLDRTDDGHDLSHALEIRPDRLSLDVPRRDAAPLTLRIDAGTVRLEGGSKPGAPYRARLSLADSRIALPGMALSAEATTASLVHPAIPGQPMARFTVGKFVHTAAPAYFAPLRIEGAIDQRDDRLALNAAAVGGGGTLRFSARGWHRIADARGAIRVQLPETAFGKGGLQPADLSPLLRDIRDATGRIGASAEFGWRGGRLDSGGTLDLSDISFGSDALTVAGLDSRIVLDGLFPPSTPAGQSLTVRRADPALPLDDIAARFRIEPAEPPRLHLEAAGGRFAGGLISLAEVVIDPSRTRHDFRLGVDGVDLGALLDLLKVKDVSATGRLSGTIPVTLADRAVSIGDGQLAADGPGVLRVRSEAAAAAFGGAGEQVALMLRALEDFRYDSLSATLDSRAGGETATMIRMRGHNPAVLEGYPFAFNIALSGNLTQLVAALRQGARLSTDLVRPEAR